MASKPQDRSELDVKARHGETVVPGGTGGKSLEAQEHLAQGRSEGGLTRKEQHCCEGYQEIGSWAGQTPKEQTRKEQIGTEGYKAMGRKGGLTTKDKSSEERAEKEEIKIHQSKVRGASGEDS